MKTNLIMNVTPAGISNLEVDRLSSEMGKKAVYRTAIFSTVQSLINSAGKLAKFESYMGKLKEEQKQNIMQSNRYLDTKARAEEAAVKLACLDTLQEAHGYALEVNLEPKPQRLSTAEQIKEKAKFAEMSESEVLKIETENQNRMLIQANEGVDLATQLFFSAEIESYEGVYDEEGNQLYESAEDNLDFSRPIQTCSTKLVYFHPESVLKDLTRTRDFLLTWAQTDYAELGILVHDIKQMEAAVKKFQDITEYAGENSRQMDNLAANNQDLQQAAA